MSFVLGVHPNLVTFCVGTCMSMVSPHHSSPLWTYSIRFFSSTQKPIFTRLERHSCLRQKNFSSYFWPKLIMVLKAIGV